MSVQLFIPTYNYALHMSILQSVIGASPKGRLKSLKMSSTSAWGMQLNDGLIDAIKTRKENPELIKYLLILHADVVPVTPGWLDIMVEEAEKFDADILSAVVAIKSNSKETSTAMETGDLHHPRRMSLGEVSRFPPTFTHGDLLVNNGCMLINLEKPWVETAQFNITVGIDEKTRKPYFFSEDWLFSRVARQMGASVWATTLVETQHWGLVSFNNRL